MGCCLMGGEVWFLFFCWGMVELSSIWVVGFYMFILGVSFIVFGSNMGFYIIWDVVSRIWGLG